MNEIIYVGSVALEQHIQEIPEPRDIDMIMTYPAFKQFKNTIGENSIRECYPISDGKKFVIKTDFYIYEIEIAWEGSTAEEFMRLVVNEDGHMTSYLNGHKTYIPSLRALYAMKMSHRFLKNSPHFEKTHDHIMLMRSKLGTVDIDPYWFEWFKRRETETYEYSHPNLSVDKRSFFKDESFYKYDHDDIHEAIKLGTEPAYKSIIANGEQVKCDFNKWKNLDFQGKLNCALEESYTLALERMLIPNEFKPNPKKAFDIALKKVCTSITSGWFREWCWEHYNTIKQAYSPVFVDRFHEALMNKRIRPFTHDRV